jgi:hypothetical protein
MERAGEVDGDEPVPLGGFGIGEGTEDVPTGVVHQHVDWPKLGFRRRDRRIDARAIGDVAEEGRSRLSSWRLG